MKRFNQFKIKSTSLHAKITFIFALVFSGLNAQTLTVDTYTNPVGTTDWIVPPCVTSITVRAWGGGGAGGGARSSDRNGGGGGGGAYCTVTQTVTPGETLRITVGAGGTGVSTGTGNAGGFSQVMRVTGSVVLCRAAGGAGGQVGSSSSTAGAGGAGGSLANNIPAGTGFRGGNGGASNPSTGSSDQSGGGGGGAGSGSNGGDGAIITAGIAGSPGGGVGGTGNSTTTNAGLPGNPGVVLGGGGSGASTYTGSQAGGAGARGQVTITYTATGCEPPASVFTYTPAGTYNWVVPACVNFVTVEAFGGGGGGGGNIGVVSGGSETCTGAGGGGGGGYAARTYAVVPGQSYTIVVGAGGTAGTAGANGGPGTGVITTNAGNGGNGGNSTFSGPATVGPGTLTGTGGIGGSAAQGRNTTGGTCLAVNGAGGAGSLGLNGTVNYRGGNGTAGVIANFSTDRSGGAGGGAGPGGDGGNAPVANSVGVGVNPPGGIGNPSGGTGGNGRTYNTTGTFGGNGGNGIAIGGGGGGGLIHISVASSVTATGGTGAIGEVRLTYNTTCPLPVELMHFGGENIEKINYLTWITASERINDYFTLERSENGVDWEKVADVKGAGTTIETQNYSFEDRGFTMGVVNYYRLSQTDTDGTQEYVGKIIPLNNRFSDKKVVSRYNAMGQEVGADAKGVVITLYEDGTIDRTYVD